MTVETCLPEGPGQSVDLLIRPGLPDAYPGDSKFAEELAHRLRQELRRLGLGGWKIFCTNFMPFTPEDILDHLPHFDSRRILDGLGQAPAVEMTYFKPYSACRWIHAAVDAFEGLMADHSIAVDDIEAIEVHTFERAIKLRNHTEPETLIDVQYSVPYCLALAAVLGSAVMVPIGDDVLNRPEVSAVARKVALHLDPGLENRFPKETPARVIVSTPAGRFESPVTTPLGEPSNPMSWRALEDKFRTATRNVMDAARQEDMLGAVGKLAEGDVSPLMKALERPLPA